MQSTIALITETQLPGAACSAHVVQLHDVVANGAVPLAFMLDRRDCSACVARSAKSLPPITAVVTLQYTLQMWASTQTRFELDSLTGGMKGAVKDTRLLLH